CYTTQLLFFFQAEDGIRDRNVTGVQTCALPISWDVPTGRADAGDAPTASAAGTAAVQTPDTSRLRRERDGAGAAVDGEFCVIAELLDGSSHPAASARPNRHYLE